MAESSTLSLSAITITALAGFRSLSTVTVIVKDARSSDLMPLRTTIMPKRDYVTEGVSSANNSTAVCSPRGAGASFSWQLVQTKDLPVKNNVFSGG